MISSARDATPALVPTSTSAPFVVGASFYFVGTSLSQDTFYDGSAAQNVTGTSTATSHETNNEQVLGGASFAGVSNLYDVLEIVSAGGNPERFDNYESLVPLATSGADVVYVGDKYSGQLPESEQVTSSLVNATPQVIDVLPHAPGPAYTQSPESSYSSSETSPALGTLAVTTTTNADGSYASVDDATYPGGSYVQNWQMNPDFSGVHTVTYGSDAYPSTEDTIAAPLQGSIAVAHYSGNGSASPTPGPAATIVDWYPAASGATPILYSQTHQDMGSGHLPAACKAPAKFDHAPVWDVRTIVDYFDVWGDDTASGTYSATTQDEYVSDSIGELCITDETTIVAYSTATGYPVGRYQSSGALALQSSQVPTAPSVQPAIALAPLRADAAVRLRAVTLRFVRGLEARNPLSTGGRPLARSLAQ